MGRPAGLPADAILGVLVEKGARFVVIGSFAARLHGARTRAADLDIVPAVDPANFVALSETFRVLLDQYLRRVGTPPDDLTIPKDLGLDVSYYPTGGGDYETLRTAAAPFVVGGTEVMVASVDDLRHLFRATDRDKDRRRVALLDGLGSGAQA